MKASVEQRRDQIVSLLKEKQRVWVVDLSRRFGVSEVVIRKDLACLEELGMLKRRHGGAVRTPQGYLYKDFDERLRTRQGDKLRIAQAARDLIAPGQAVMLNSGSTTHHIMQALAQIEDLTIITNSIRPACDLAHAANLQVILLGGQIKVKYQFTYGQDTLKQLGKYHADICFVSVDGINAQQGLTSYYHYEAEVIRQMMAQSNQVIVVADSSKVGHVSLEQIGELQTVDLLITNQSAPGEQLAQLCDQGVQVKLV